MLPLYSDGEVCFGTEIGSCPRKAVVVLVTTRLFRWRERWVLDKVLESEGRRGLPCPALR